MTNASRYSQYIAKFTITTGNSGRANSTLACDGPIIETFVGDAQAQGIEPEECRFSEAPAFSTTAVGLIFVLHRVVETIYSHCK